MDINNRKHISILCLSFSRDLPIAWSMIYTDNCYLDIDAGPPILAVYVKKRFRKNGIGTKLCSMALARSDFDSYLVDDADGRDRFFDTLPMLSESMV